MYKCLVTEMAPESPLLIHPSVIQLPVLRAAATCRITPAVNGFEGRPHILFIQNVATFSYSGRQRHVSILTCLLGSLPLKGHEKSPALGVKWTLSPHPSVSSERLGMPNAYIV